MSDSSFNNDILWTIHGLPQRAAKSKAETAISEFVHNDKVSLRNKRFFGHEKKVMKKESLLKQASNKKEGFHDSKKRKFDETGISESSEKSLQSEEGHNKHKMTRKIKIDASLSTKSIKENEKAAKQNEKTKKKVKKV
jgi:hypothetical protein